MEKPRIRIMNSDPDLNYSDIRSAMKATTDIVDGIVLVGKGLFKLIAFSVMTVYEGLKELFSDGKKGNYVSIAKLKERKGERK